MYTFIKPFNLSFFSITGWGIDLNYRDIESFAFSYCSWGSKARILKWFAISFSSGPPGSPIPGILQARTLEWVAISFSNLLELTPKKDALFIIGDWNAKVGSQEIPGVTGKFGL